MMQDDKRATGNDFVCGEADGRKDGAAGVKPLGQTILARHYSSSYRTGYEQGYAKASEPRRMRAAGSV